MSLHLCQEQASAGMDALVVPLAVQSQADLCRKPELVFVQSVGCAELVLAPVNIWHDQCNQTSSLLGNYSIQLLSSESQ